MKAVTTKELESTMIEVEDTEDQVNVWTEQTGRPISIGCDGPFSVHKTNNSFRYMYIYITFVVSTFPTFLCNFQFSSVDYYLS